MEARPGPLGGLGSPAGSAALRTRWRGTRRVPRAFQRARSKKSAKFFSRRGCKYFQKSLWAAAAGNPYLTPPPGSRPTRYRSGPKSEIYLPPLSLTRIGILACSSWQ